MELLLEIYENVGLHRRKTARKGYFFRRAARAVIIKQGKVALLHVSKLGYYKLPGGGIEPGEEAVSAAIREAKEETGCTIKIKKEVGAIIEQRMHQNLLQLSYCFIAEPISETMPNLTDEESKKGFKLVWLCLPDALAALKKKSNGSKDASSILKRDYAFLKKAAEIISAGP